MPPRKTKTSKPKTAYFNRELSWLAFNRRVLEQARDSRYPVLERLRFLTFVSSNLDEFFEIRVSGLIQQMESNVVESGPDGLGPKEQLRRIHNISVALVHDQYQCWREQIVPELRQHGIFFKGKEDLTRREMQWLKQYFTEQVYPVLTPLAIDPSHPFPQFGNKKLYILLALRDPSRPKGDSSMAFIPVPRILPRIVSIGAASRNRHSCIFLSDVLKIFAKPLFPGYRIKSVQAFRITRNSDLYIDEEEAENLLQTIEEELHKMRRGQAVRLEIEKGVDEALLARLLQSVHLAPEHVFRIDGPINLMRLMSVYDMIDRPDLKFQPFIPYVSPALGPGEDLFAALWSEDHLLHHPFDSFTPVIDFVQQAAADPAVLAIKLTLYRTSSQSPIMDALMEAARQDKQVTALIELKARFDEAQNIQWARQLEEAGVHVVYGFVGLKTHCKCCLVVRREAEGLKRYVHLGTGNYHPQTAKLYTDLSYFTCREDIAGEVAMVFNTLTGFARDPKFKKLLVAPYNLHARIQKYIQREKKHAKAGRPARIIIKANSLIDKETIDNLYAASRAGVPVDLIIRGICGLVPGVKGMSDNIRVRSILGRYLEHSRIYYFENDGGQPEILSGSADMMPRNFYRRIEVVFPLEQEDLRSRVVKDILDPSLKDNAFAKVLKPNGSYKSPSVRASEPLFSSQEHFIGNAEKFRRRSERAGEAPAAGSSG